MDVPVIQKQFNCSSKLSERQNEIRKAVHQLFIGLKLQEAKDILLVVDYELNYITISK